MLQAARTKILIGVTTLAAIGAAWSFLGSGGSSAHSAESPAAPAPAPAASVAPVEVPTNPAWLSEMQEVMTLARAKHLDVLMQFSATEDTPETLAMTQSLNDPAFTSRATEHFVLMRFESRASVVQSERALATRDLWADRLGLTSFPALILLDNQGRAYAGCGVKPVGAPDLLAAVNDLQSHRVKRDEAFARADKAEGTEKAVAFDAGLREVGTYAKDGYLDVMEKIVAADPSNAAHLREKYIGRVAETHIDHTMQQEIYPLIDQSKYREALTRLTTLVQDERPPTAQMQLLLAFEGQLCHNLGDDPQAIAKLGEAIALDPNSEQAAKVRVVREQIVSAQKPAPDTRP